MRGRSAFGVVVGVAIALGGCGRKADATAEPRPSASGRPAAHAPQPHKSPFPPTKASQKADDARELAAVEAAIARGKPTAEQHYARGVLLGRLGRDADAVAAYRAALALDPKAADAQYNLGGALARLGKTDEAIAAWDAAAVLEPKNVDARYNAAQAFYNRRDFAGALTRWQAAAKIAPDDFDIAKKVLQCENALGHAPAADAAWSTLEAVWRRSQDPKIRGLKEVVVDQLDVKGQRVFAYKRLAPPSEGIDIDYALTAAVVDPPERRRFSVQIETSAYARERGGAAFLVGVTHGGRHKGGMGSFAKLPTWLAWKPAAIKLIEAELTSP